MNKPASPDRLRRQLVLGMGALAAAPGVALAAPAHAPASRADNRANTLWYRQSAARWEEALPLGNGRLGAMVFGCVAQDRLQLNEDTLWAGAPYTPDNPAALAALPKVRQLLAQGKYAEATEEVGAAMMGKPVRQMSYGTLGDVLLTMRDAQAPADYERSLDLASAVTTTRYRTSLGQHTRESFVSAPDQVIAMRLQAPRGTLGFTLGWRGPRKVKSIASNYPGLATDLANASPTDWLQVEEAGPLPPDAAIAADGPDAILITGRNEAMHGIPAGLRYALRIQVLGDGKLRYADGQLTLAGASTATVLVAAATSHVNYRDVSGDPVAIVRRQMAAVANTPYATLKRRHVEEHGRLFGTMSVDLGTTPAAARPTDERIAAVGQQDDPALDALYLQYARYLLIASSRPGTQPANLQGIWNEGTNPPWGGKYTININTQMNYWPADPAGLGACVEPLLRMVEDLAQSGAKTAKTMYGARGWVTHHNTDLWRAAAPIDAAKYGMWPCGGAWLCNSLWDHYDYSRDAQVLRRLYPLLRGASEFFLDTLVEDPQGRGLVTSPSMSPENSHPYGSSLAAGPAMDRQIVRDLFGHTLEAGRLLGQDAALLERIAGARGRLAPDRIGQQGQLQEWLEDWDARAPDRKHRHVSHLYALYPSAQINVRDTPDLARAVRQTLVDRGDLATGWGTAWRLCLWARMGDAEHAYSVLKGLTGPRRTYPNMFDAHPPFQIDGNFGGAAGIMEMLLQSWGGEVLLLPALPAAWPTGRVGGIRARGGLTVDMSWERGRLTALRIGGKPGDAVALRYQGKLAQVILDAGGTFRSTGQALLSLA
ncbi:glycoside hydrolase family 95 protein [Pseudoduganella sp. SL102]|uniref:glycoside hydrolase family 95 protein n=1 Tax=Pseudoduganella sp. SL102 TaxID=2995154 RepID=UPI00248BB905|nr:glycoside hydrolase family 95 protein [Pseudoduganella sp. SL102]WBS05331.1 glycoside hydrolase family 95 protein [Pseudoduganella sp. SL102]